MRLGPHRSELFGKFAIALLFAVVIGLACRSLSGVELALLFPTLAIVGYVLWLCDRGPSWGLGSKIQQANPVEIATVFGISLVAGLVLLLNVVV